MRQTSKLDYGDWTEGIKQGRNYVSDGKSHLIDFKVNEVEMGSGASEHADGEAPGTVHVTARVAALLDESPNEAVRKLSYDQKPYWDLERSRIGNTRTVPLELVVNGVAVAYKEIPADGILRPVSFDYKVDRSSWIALRILPSSHTNPIFTLVGDKPIRSKSSAEWCLRAGVDQCWRQKEARIRIEERGEAVRAYELARDAYRQRMAE